MITCCECGAVSQIGAVLFHNEPCRRTLGTCSGCNGTSIQHDPGACTVLAKKWSEAFSTSPDALNRTLDTQHARIKQLEVALRSACGFGRDLEKTLRVPLPIVGEWEAILGGAP